MERTGGYSRPVHRYNIAVDDFKNFGTLLLALHSDSFECKPRMQPSTSFAQKKHAWYLGNNLLLFIDVECPLEFSCQPILIVCRHLLVGELERFFLSTPMPIAACRKCQQKWADSRPSWRVLCTSKSRRASSLRSLLHHCSLRPGRRRRSLSSPCCRKVWR